MMTSEYKKESVAMLLAGGRGERLRALTAHIAKPAVAFGGKFRMVDFTLSNCVHSGIDTVGVLTQYLPMFLHDYIGKGQPWDLDRLSGGVFLLPPYSTGERADWYSGTANSIYQNLRFIESYKPPYVFVLSSDHVYKMDYSVMLDEHKRTGADCTIAVIEVPQTEASRYGIINTEGDKITGFEEKPKKPKSKLASMGIYVFKRETLREYLELDHRDKTSEHDFGKNVIPAMLTAGLDLRVHRFKGYWKDVGTLESLWEANMDLLEDMTLGRPDWPILSRNRAMPPHYIAPSGRVINSLVSADCQIYGTVLHSVLSGGVIVEEGAVVRDCVVMSGAVIRRDAKLEYTILDERAVVEAGETVGTPREPGNEPTLIPGVWE